MPSKEVRYGPQVTTGPTYDLWHDCKIPEIDADMNVGYGHGDNFTNCPRTNTGASGTIGLSPGKGYCFFGDTDVLGMAEPQGTEGTDALGGVMEVSVNDSDNDEFVMSTGSPTFMVTDTNAYKKKLRFECRVKRASIADNACGMFVGLAWDHGAGVPVAKTLCLTDDDMALGAFSYLGFHVDAADGDAINFVYKAEGQAQTDAIAGIVVPVADTYNKLGFVYDPFESADKRITCWIDGAPYKTTYITETNIAAATFPDAEPMAMVWCVKTGAAAASLAQMSFWQCYQDRVCPAQ